MKFKGWFRSLFEKDYESEHDEMHRKFDKRWEESKCIKVLDKHIKRLKEEQQESSIFWNRIELLENIKKEILGEEK